MVDYDRSQLKCLVKVLVCRDANRRVLHFIYVQTETTKQNWKKDANMKTWKKHFSFWRKLEPERLAKETLIAIKDTSPAPPPPQRIDPPKIDLHLKSQKWL